MRTIFILFLLWVLGWNASLPVPVLVILCAALGSGLAATVWFAFRHRRQPAKAVAAGDAKSEIAENSR